jgi:hypothetical protein
MRRTSLKFIIALALMFSFGLSVSLADEKDKKKSKQPTTGSLKIKTESGSYPIFIDGKQIGESSPEEKYIDGIEPGQREIEVRFSDGRTWKKTETFIAGKPVCLCFKRVTRKIDTPCPHLAQVDVPDAINEGDLVTFTSNVNIAPNVKNISPAMVNFNEFTRVDNLARILRDGQTPAAQCLYNRFSAKTQGLLGKNVAFGSTTAVSRADLTQASLLALKLRSGGDPLTAFLKGNLSSATRKALNNFDGSSPLSDKVLDGLITDLNKIINSGAIYNKDRFVGINMMPETKSLLAQTTLNADGVKRLNRLLLEDAFPLEIKRSSSGNINNLELGNALADEFNLLIKGPALTNVSCLSGVEMSAATKKLAGGGLTGEGLRSLNRLLLEDAFPGEIAQLGKITAQFNTPVRYIWTVSPSNARIIGPADRDSITVDSTNLGGQTISAKLVVDDGRADALCRQMDEASTKVRKVELPQPRRWKHDEFPSRAYDDVKARLDAYVIELQNKPDSKGYIILYSGAKSKPAQTQKLNAKVIDYLVKDRGFPPERIVILQGGKRDDDFVELWVVESGADPPTPGMPE